MGCARPATTRPTHSFLFPTIPHRIIARRPLALTAICTTCFFQVAFPPARSVVPPSPRLRHPVGLSNRPTPDRAGVEIISSSGDERRSDWRFSAYGESPATVVRRSVCRSNVRPSLTRSFSRPNYFGCCQYRLRLVLSPINLPLRRASQFVAFAHFYHRPIHHQWRH